MGVNGKMCYFAHSREEIRPSPEFMMMNQMMGMSMMMNSPASMMGGSMMPPHMPPHMPHQLRPQLPSQMPIGLPMPMLPMLTDSLASDNGFDKKNKKKCE